MNVAVFCMSSAMGEGAQIHLAISVQTSTGYYSTTDVPLDFVASSTITRTRILDRAKAYLVEQGIPGASTATYRLFGGPA